MEWLAIANLVVNAGIVISIARLSFHVGKWTGEHGQKITSHAARLDRLEGKVWA